MRVQSLCCRDQLHSFVASLAFYVLPLNLTSYFAQFLLRMGRNKTNTSRDFFTYHEAVNKSVCNICDTPLTGNHAANLERHLKRHHNGEFETVQQRKKIYIFEKATSSTSSGSQRTPVKNVSTELLKVKLNKELVLEACIELITLNGCSFEMLDYSGFQKIMNPIVTAMSDSFSVSSEDIKILIPEAAFKITSEISTVLEKKMISLKIDIATRLNRSILGINAQLIREGKINLFTLGMTEIKDKHPGICVKNMVEKVLEMYNIDTEQIYSIIMDNGADVISSVNLSGSGTEDEGIEGENENFETRDPLEGEVFFNRDFPFNHLIGIKCAVHVLQLAIKDAIKMADLNDIISDARELVKLLRNPSVLSKFKDAYMSKPVLNCPTKWNSTYNMLKSLLECKDFSLYLAESNLDYYRDESTWEKLKLIVDTLQPLTEATLKLQTEQMTLSDFYGTWIHCKIKLQDFKNFFADLLHAQLSNKEMCFIKNDSLLGAVYLDPRFQILLSPSQKAQAVQHLKTVWNQLQFLEKFIKPIFIKNEEAESSNESNEKDDLEKFLKSKELALMTRKLNMPTDFDIEVHLNKFDNVPRLDVRHNILDFWEENKFIYPHLYKIATVVLGAPATQVSVKRVFSGLEFILRDDRSQLDETTLEDILLIRSNFEMLNK